jgi:hypothetical protein
MDDLISIDELFESKQENTQSLGVLRPPEYFISIQKKYPQSPGVLHLLDNFMLSFNSEEISPIPRSAAPAYSLVFTQIGSWVSEFGLLNEGIHPKNDPDMFPKVTG